MGFTPELPIDDDGDEFDDDITQRFEIMLMKNGK